MDKFVSGMMTCKKKMVRVTACKDFIKHVGLTAIVPVWPC